LAYGLNFKEQSELSKKLSERLEVPTSKVDEALDSITTEKLLEVAKNEIKCYN